MDLKYQKVFTHIHIALLLVGMFNVNVLSVIGYITAFLPFLIVALKGGIGGGDVKFAGMCGFVMQGINGLAGLILGLLIALLIVPIIQKIKHKKEPFPLIPYLSIGCGVIGILGGI